MAGPLAGLRVLDLSRILAGPWAGQLLADLGAEVIKVERQGEGDDTRTWGPPFLADQDGRDTAESGYYLSANRGKRSIALDLASPAGQHAVRTLAAEADIVLENFKVGTLDRYGLGYEALKAINPRLIYCSITGFGQDGPRAQQPAYDFMIQAMGGLMSVTGERDDLPGGGPQKVGIPIIDLLTGIYAATAVTAALHRRHETGEGDHIDIAMLDVAIGILANQGMNYLISGKSPRRGGNRHPNIQPQDVYPCRDGHLALVVGNNTQFERFCAVIGRPELPRDPRFAANGDRVRNCVELRELIIAELARDDAADWVRRLDAANVPCAPINTIPQALADEQVVHRRMLRELAHPVAGKVPQIVAPIKYRSAVLEFDRAPPMLGEHDPDILTDLAWSRSPAG